MKILFVDSSEIFFVGEFDYVYFGLLDLCLGKFGEVVFFYWFSYILLVMDILLVLLENFFLVLELDFIFLMFYVRDKVGDCLEDNFVN